MCGAGGAALPERPVWATPELCCGHGLGPDAAGSEGVVRMV